jgi:3-hydroxyacyl-[acyl-carrier-protein] dehydratase
MSLAAPGMRGSICAALLSGPVPQPDGTYNFEFRFSSADPVFAGHFPGHPLLPGIFQIEMNRVAAEKVLGGALEIRDIVRAKFLRPILPEERIGLNLKLSEEGSMIDARAVLSAGGQATGQSALRLCRSV